MLLIIYKVDMISKWWSSSIPGWHHFFYGKVNVRAFISIDYPYRIDFVIGIISLLHSLRN
jgi:hypothetical protein